MQATESTAQRSCIISTVALLRCALLRCTARTQRKARSVCVNVPLLLIAYSKVGTIVIHFRRMCVSLRLL